MSQVSQGQKKPPSTSRLNRDSSGRVIPDGPKDRLPVDPNSGRNQAAYVAHLGQFGHVEAETIKGNSTTGYVQVNSLTTTQRDALTAAAGMIIYNTTDSKFQGYENGAWVNLI